MKEILLVPGPALSNKIEVTVMDFPNGNDRDPRKRCKITVEYGRPDVLELQKQGKNLSESIEHYKDYIYKLVKFHILSDWTPLAGMDEILEIVEERIKPYF